MSATPVCHISCERAMLTNGSLYPWYTQTDKETDGQTDRNGAVRNTS